MESVTNNNKRKIDKTDFLSDQFTALKEALHTDVIVKPGDDGPGIRAHKAVLAVKSKVFRDMLDDCKLSQGESITIPELNYEELETLLEFFYSGNLNHESKHIRALYLAADKYDIQYLQNVCQQILTLSLTSDNFVDIYKLSTIISDTILKEAVLHFAIKKLNVFSSQGFESSKEKNKDLSLEILQACMKKLEPFASYWRYKF